MVFLLYKKMMLHILVMYVDKAEVLNKHCASVFTKDPGVTVPNL